MWVEGRALPPVSTATMAAPLSSPTSVPPSSTPASSAPDSVAPVALGNADLFVAAVRRDLPDLAVDRRDEEIAALGNKACALVRGDRQDDLAEYGVSTDQELRLTKIAEAGLCP
ncbi:hypothetical protein Areg01_14000 [Actinoplanes regularis]|nr:hypothetical protein Areg01_14000 [Actinoplanes regularis]